MQPNNPCHFLLCSFSSQNICTRAQYNTKGGPGRIRSTWLLQQPARDTNGRRMLVLLPTFHKSPSDLRWPMTRFSESAPAGRCVPLRTHLDRSPESVEARARGTTKCDKTTLQALGPTKADQAAPHTLNVFVRFGRAVGRRAASAGGAVHRSEATASRRGLCTAAIWVGIRCARRWQQTKMIQSAG